MSKNKDRVAVRDQMIAQAAEGRPFFDALAEAGAAAIELQIDPDLSTPHVRDDQGRAYSLAGEADIDAFARALSARGVRTSAVLLMTDFSSERSAEQVAWTIQSGKIAAALGAPALRVDPLTRNKQLPAEVVRDNCIAALRRVLEGSAGVAVDFGMENHGPFGNDPDFLDAILQEVNDPRLGLTLDTGNFLWWGVSLEELYPLLSHYAPLARHTHLKNIAYPPELAAARRPIGTEYGRYCCALDEGAIDVRRAVKILLDAGYARDFCIENESLHKVPAGQKLGMIAREVGFLRSVLRDLP